jgi:hypothetical protein
MIILALHLFVCVAVLFASRRDQDDTAAGIHTGSQD